MEYKDCPNYAENSNSRQVYCKLLVCRGTPIGRPMEGKAGFPCYSCLEGLTEYPTAGKVSKHIQDILDTWKIYQCGQSQTNNRPAAMQAPAPIPAPDAVKEPSLYDLYVRFKAAMMEWKDKGFPLVSLPVLASRFNECKKCQYWTGWRCSHAACGCSAAKLGVATEECPIGKWRREA